LGDDDNDFEILFRVSIDTTLPVFLIMAEQLLEQNTLGLKGLIIKVLLQDLFLHARVINLLRCELCSPSNQLFLVNSD
jgi:hypothetical protein